MNFGTPGYWMALPLVLLALILGMVLRRNRQQRLDSLIPDQLRSRMLRQPGSGLPRLRMVMGGLGLMLVAFSLTRPQWGVHWREVQRRGLDIMVVLDTSNSMRATDLKPDRLQRAKWGIQDLVKRLKGDRIGLIAFAGSSFTQCPLTLDYAAFRMQLDDVFPGIIPRGGTDLAGALKRAADSFDPHTAADRVILMISDGENHEGGLEEELTRLRKEKIRVYVVGVGSPQGELIPDGNGGFLKNRQNEVIKTKLNETVLKQIALDSNGLYVRATGSDFGLERIFEEGLSTLKKAQLDSGRIRELEDRYQIFLGSGVLLLLLEGLVRLPGLWKGRSVQ